MLKIPPHIFSSWMQDKDLSAILSALAYGIRPKAAAVEAACITMMNEIEYLRAELADKKLQLEEEKKYNMSLRWPMDRQEGNLAPFTGAGDYIPTDDWPKSRHTVV